MPSPRTNERTRQITGLVLALLTIINSFALSGYSSDRVRETADQPDREAGATSSSRTNHQPDKATRKRINGAFDKLPLSFEANRGQTIDEVKFISRGKGYSLYLTPTEALISLRPRSGVNRLKKIKEELQRRDAAEHGVQLPADESRSLRDFEPHHVRQEKQRRDRQPIAPSLCWLTGFKVAVAPPLPAG